MYKTIKFFNDNRIFAYVIPISFIVNTFIVIGMNIVDGEINESIFYKLTSIAWAIMFLVSIKAMDDAIEVMNNVSTNINEIKGMGPPSQDQIDRERLINTILQRNIKKDQLD